VFDAVKAATDAGTDVLIVDTAGRLHNKRELMDELAKVRRVLGRLNPGRARCGAGARCHQRAERASADRDLQGCGGRLRPDHDQAGRHRARRRAGGGGRAIWPADPRHRRGRTIDDLRPFDPDLVAKVIASERATEQAKPKSSWVNLAVDYGPLLVFFLAYRHFSPDKGAGTGVGAVVAITKSTVAFMAATVVALVVSKWRLGRISPMLWLSTVLIWALARSPCSWAIRSGSRSSPR
jgi:hypothetical protein